MSLRHLSNEELIHFFGQRGRSELSARIAHLTATAQVLEVKAELQRRGLAEGDLSETEQTRATVRGHLEQAHAMRRAFIGGGGDA